MEISINQYKGSQIEKGFVNQINEKPSIEQIEKALESNLEKGLISEDLFNKAMDELDLIKAGGEGSKGGKVIGHTKSGKPIYDSRHETPNMKSFTKEDHQDAVGIYKKKGEEYKKDNAVGEHGEEKHKYAKFYENYHKDKAKKLENKETGHEAKAKVLGKTSSGKDVYQSQKNHKDFKDWSDKDHAEAYDMHKKQREKVGDPGAGAPSSAFGPHSEYAHKHYLEIVSKHPDLKEKHEELDKKESNAEGSTEWNKSRDEQHKFKKQVIENAHKEKKD